MRVVALTQGKDVPSSRFRIRQCLPGLRRAGIDVQEYCPAVRQYVQLPGRLGQVRRRYLLPLLVAQTGLNLLTRTPGTLAGRRADLVWLSRGFIPGLDGLVGLTGRPRVLDVDDAVWLTNPLGPARTARFAAGMDLVIAGNTYLADWYGQHCRRVEIVPTSVDCRRYAPRTEAGAADRFCVGWIGTSGNFPFLRDVFDGVERFLADHADACFLLVADRRPSWWPGDSERLTFRQWSVAQEVALLNTMDVGLMPLADTDWARGKCAYKMLQYMAVAIPVIVSPVGMNREVLDLGDCGLAAQRPDDWYEALKALHDDETRRRAMGATGRRIATTHFATEVVVGRYAELFRELAS